MYFIKIHEISPGAIQKSNGLKVTCLTSLYFESEEDTMKNEIHQPPMLEEKYLFIKCIEELVFTERWCLQWNMVVAVSLCGAAWVLLVSGSWISLMASWIHKCTALYWKRRCYRHSVPLVVVHFSNMTMILNTHLSHCWISEEEQGESDSVAKYVSWSEPNRTPILKRQVEHHSPSSIHPTKY